jgi:hypothetical protein
MTRRTLPFAIAAAVLTLSVTATTLAARRSPKSDRVTGSRVAPRQRVRVQVLNATRTRGLGRRAMLYLRDQGFDVVEIGTLSATRDSTVVLDRSGHADWARRVAAALGGARVELRPDSSRYLDVTVLIGGSWRPPADPFYP